MRLALSASAIALGSAKMAAVGADCDSERVGGGVLVFRTVGAGEGAGEGAGVLLGSAVGVCDGAAVGFNVGTPVGPAVGLALGVLVGVTVGAAVAKLGAAVVGALVGTGVSTTKAHGTQPVWLRSVEHGVNIGAGGSVSDI